MRRKLIILLFTISCLPLCLISFYYYTLIEKSTMDAYTETNLQTLSAVQKDIHTYLDRHRSVLRLLALNPQISSLDPTTKNYLVEIRKQYPKLEIAVDDLQGNMVFRDDDQKLVNISHREYFQTAAKGKESTSEVLISATSGLPTLNMGIPLQTAQGVTGVIQGGNALAHLSEFLAGHIDKKYTAFIADSTGKIFIHTNPEFARERPDISEEKFFHEGFTQQKNGFVISKDPNGQDIYTYYLYDNENNWLICTQLPSDIVRAPIVDMQKKAGLVFFVLHSLKNVVSNQQIVLH